MKAAISKDNSLIKSPCLTEPSLHPLRSRLECAVILIGCLKFPHFLPSILKTFDLFFPGQLTALSGADLTLCRSNISLGILDESFSPIQPTDRHLLSFTSSSSQF